MCPHTREGMVSRIFRTHSCREFRAQRNEDEQNSCRYDNNPTTFLNAHEKTDETVIRYPNRFVEFSQDKERLSSKS